jgi:hypothetical protein
MSDSVWITAIVCGTLLIIIVTSMILNRKT